MNTLAYFRNIFRTLPSLISRQALEWWTTVPRIQSRLTTSTMSTNRKQSTPRVWLDTITCQRFQTSTSPRWKVICLRMCHVRMTRASPPCSPHTSSSSCCLTLVARLSAREVEQRRHAGSTAYALQRLSEYSYRGEFSLSTSDTEALATKLHVHQSIVTYNAHRFRAQFFSVMDLRAWFRRRVVDEPQIISPQVAIILEFYLNMDGRRISLSLALYLSLSSVDVFYMKTCSFRGAQPHGPNQGLFCETDEPIARYGFLACQRSSCACCHPTHVEPWPVVTFSAQSKHCFVNGYTTYLNCPAVRLSKVTATERIRSIDSRRVRQAM